MTDQLDLTDALARVEAHADDGWLRAARDAVWRIALHNAHLTSDDVWAALDLLPVTTHEPRAMGAVMRWAQREGYITSTRTYVPSTRSACHGRPVPVWRSLLRTEGAA